MGLENEINELRDRADELSRLKLDVIRVLAIFNGVSWISEIIPDIVKLRGRVPDYALTDTLLDRALEELRSSGLVIVESRRRGMFPSKGVYEDKLVKLKDLGAVRRALAGDEIYKGYLSRQMEAIKRAMEDIR